MNETDFSTWRSMDSAPRDGRRVLVAVRASEQGPAEVDTARWASPERGREACWIAADSDPGCPIIYAEAELSCWMPIPTPPKPATPRTGEGRTARKGRAAPDELGGSGI
jgi:hypothetical protein